VQNMEKNKLAIIIRFPNAPNPNGGIAIFINHQNNQKRILGILFLNNPLPPSNAQQQQQQQQQQQRQQQQQQQQQQSPIPQQTQQQSPIPQQTQTQTQAPPQVQLQQFSLQKLQQIQQQIAQGRIQL